MQGESSLIDKASNFIHSFIEKCDEAFGSYSEASGGRSSNQIVKFPQFFFNFLELSLKNSPHPSLQGLLLTHVATFLTVVEVACFLCQSSLLFGVVVLLLSLSCNNSTLQIFKCQSSACFLATYICLMKAFYSSGSVQCIIFPIGFNCIFFHKRLKFIHISCLNDTRPKK